MVLSGSLLVFLRYNIGARLLIRRRFVFAAAALIAFAYYQAPFDTLLAAYAALIVILVFIHRWRHMRRIKRGNPEWHTYSPGHSLIFFFLPLPTRFVHLIIEPLLCGLIGWWLARRGGTTLYLGWWIMIAAAFLYSLELEIGIARRKGLLDLGDAFVESAYFAHMADTFTGQPPPRGRATGRSGRAAFFSAVSRPFRIAAELIRDARRRRRETSLATRGMSVAQALEILELTAGATEQEIRTAYNRLIQRVHPDAGGSTFFAKQLNAARDVLLKSNRGRRS